MPARINAVSSSHVQRSDSFRSERSDASAANKRVSFQPRVDVKHFAGQQKQQSAGGATGTGQQPDDGRPSVPSYNVYKEPTSLTEVELAREAERIIQQVDQISCTVSPNAPAGRLVASGSVGYETRSLERPSQRNKRNNNIVQQQQSSQTGSWTKTLPSTTKNQLDKGNVTVTKKTKNVEKSTNVMLNNNFQQRQQQPTPSPPIETTSFLPTRKETITPPKYDSGIEMEGGSLNRPNVNLIVQQLTEEARQRELIRRQYQEELMRMAAETGEPEPVEVSVHQQDPLAPRLPQLNLIEPDPQFGVAHNRNLPFSYTGGVSPTRLSPLRSSQLRFPSPPRRPSLTQPEDVVYAQVKMDRQRSYSPERTTDKVSGKLNFQRQQSAEVLRQHFGPDDSGGGGHQMNSMDRAKARFLFGDDGRNNNNHNNQNNGLSYRYSSLIKEGHHQQQQQYHQQQRQHEDIVDSAGQGFKTKIVIGEDRSSQPKIFQQYKSNDYDDDEYHPKYRDRSVSPEPRLQPVSSRIRTIEMKGGQQQTTTRTNQTMLSSARLIQDAERGRASVRRPVAATNNKNEFATSSRLVQQQQHRSSSRHPIHHDPEDGQPPKPPIRVKKLSRERPTVGDNKTSKVAFGKTRTVPWRPDASPESSPERFITTSSYQNQSSTQKRESGGVYRYNPRSVSPSPERVIIQHNIPEPENNKQEKIRRQRSKFLSVFLGSNKNSAGSSSSKPVRVVQHKKQQAPLPPVTRWTDDEMEFVRQPTRSSSSRPVMTSSSKYRVAAHHKEVSTNSAHNRRRDSSMTDRTDTSESDEVHRSAQHQRFKSQRVKSQSFTNLSGSHHYRPDPAVVLTEEVQHRGDARPYASTNVIKNNRMRADEEEDDVIIPRPNVVMTGRPVRYFGDTDLESQQSASYQRTGGRFVPRAKVMRSASSAAGMGAVKRGLIQKNGTHLPSSSNNNVMNGTSKKPAVISSSLNSSESDGSAMAPAGGSADSSQRSVYLHATTVADIPTVAAPTNQNKLQAARKRAQSREDMSALSGSSSGSALRKTRQISRSYSVLAPWKPRHYRDKFEISYSNQQAPTNNNNNTADTTGKPPRAPRVQRRDDVILEDENAPYEPVFVASRSPTVFTNRPAQPPQQHRHSPTATGVIVQPVMSSSSNPSTVKVSRSSTMPKGGNSGTSRVAGWFRSKKKQPR